MATIGRKRRKQSGYKSSYISGQSNNNRDVYDTTRWRKLRLVKKEQRRLECIERYGIDAPLCEVETEGLSKADVQRLFINDRIHLGTICDHIKEINPDTDGSEGDAWNLENLQWLSKRSHEKKNAIFKNKLYNVSPKS